MKKYIYLLNFFLLTCNSLIGQTFQWVNTVGGSDTDEAYCVALDPSGNPHIAGLYSSSATIGGNVFSGTGLTGMFVAKYNSAGGSVWANDGGGTNSSGGHVLTVDNSGNVYITGEFDSTMTIGATVLTSSGMRDIFLAKYNSSGTLQWAKKAGGAGDESANSIRTDANGNVYISGHFEDTAYFDTQQSVSAGGEDIFVAKYNSFGNVVWLTSAGGPFDDSARGIAIDNGNICIAGSFNDNAVFGSTTLTATNPQSDAFIARLNPSGVFQWAKSGGGTGVEVAYDIAFDGAGNSYITGLFQNTANFSAFSIVTSGNDEIFTAKYDASGNVQWAISAGGAGKDKAYSIAVNSVGTFFITGSFEDTASFGGQQLISYGDKDMFVACYNSSGIVQWVRQAGGPGFDRGYGITYDNAGGLYVTGIYEQTATFGSNTVTSAGLRDLFVTKIDLTSGLNDMSDSQNTYQIFPNPVSNTINVQFVKNIKLPQQLRIFNTLGDNVFSKTITNVHEKIDVYELPPGLYVVKINDQLTKIIKD